MRTLTILGASGRWTVRVAKDTVEKYQRIVPSTSPTFESFFGKRLATLPARAQRLVSTTSTSLELFSTFRNSGFYSPRQKPPTVAPPLRPWAAPNRRLSGLYEL
ncbi:hypothetical protein FS842_003364 [Serendipita sp. 407]|nr:hypothetical protein FS842_003364 [Serendipita sp. 407]